MGTVRAAERCSCTAVQVFEGILRSGAACYAVLMHRHTIGRDEALAWVSLVRQCRCIQQPQMITAPHWKSSFLWWWPRCVVVTGVCPIIAIQYGCRCSLYAVPP